MYKAAFLQQQLPNAWIVPVLVCRRAHITAFRLAKDLGAYIIATQRQWLLRHSRITQEVVNEVRNELNFFDLNLIPGNPLDPYTYKQLTEVLPNSLPEQAVRWRQAGSRFADKYFDLWFGGNRKRLAQIRDEMSGEDWYQGGW